MIRNITAFFFLLFLPLFVYGAGTTGKINGKVVDLQTGEPLIGANIIVVGTSFGAATDVRGEYQISYLDPGVYEVKASYLGYQTVTTSNVRVNADLTTELNFQLPSTGVSVGEVTIIAQRPLVNKSNTNAIRVTTNEEIQALPIRGIENIAALTPGVIQQEGNLYIRGGRQDEVGYYLEGANITNPVVDGLRGGPQYSASQVTIPQDAVEEISVQAGGYTAAYGGANAGIIQTQLKTGTQRFKATLQYITDNWTFKNSSERYNGAQNLGTYSYGFNDVTGTISGPLFTEHVKFFGLFENSSRADRNPTFTPGFNIGQFADNTSDTVNLVYPGGPIPGNTSNQYSGAATFTFDYNPTIVRLYGTFSFGRDRLTGGPYTMFDLNRLPIRDNYNGVFGLKLTQILTPSSYLEVSGSYTLNNGKTYDPQMGDNFLAYGDKAANDAAGVPWTYPVNQTSKGPYDVPSPYTIYSTFSFAVPNMPLVGNSDNSISRFSKFSHTNIDISASYSNNINKQNSLKVGGEFQMMTISSYRTSARINYAQQIAQNPEKSIQSILIQDGINNYGYDVLGNSYSGSSNFSTGSIAPHKPIFAAAYIEDRLEYKNLIVNAGLRYDYISTDNYIFADPTRPDQVFDPTTLNVIYPENYVKAPSFSSLSPRLGFSFPITDATVFHAQYGKFVQQPSLSDIYVSPYQVAYLINPNAGLFNQAPWGLDLRPTRTTQYEIGFTQQIANFASFDITAYYKDIADQVTFGDQSVLTSTGWRPYQILTNGDYATTQGIEIDFNMRRTARFLVNGSVSFQNGRGTGDNPYTNSGEYGAAIQNILYTPKYVVPLAFNHAINGNLNIDYRFGKDDGPAILHEFGASILLTFSSGHPYTLGTIKTPGTSDPNAIAITDTRNRYAIEPLNSSVTPSNFQLDFRVDKTVEFFDSFSANIFIQVINLLNTKNVTDVYSNTGSASTNGFLTNPNLTGYQNVQRYGQDYATAYQESNINYAGLYGTPRQIRLGIRLEY